MVEAEEQQHNQRQLARVVQVASAVGLGAVASFLFSLKSITPSLQFEFSARSLIAGLLAAALSWAFWRIAFRLAAARQAAGKTSGPLWFATIAATLIIVTAGGFAYSVKDVGREKLSEVAIGAGIAIAALTFFGYLICRVGRFFTSESEDVETRKPPH